MALPININELLHGNTIEWDRIELKKGWNPEDIIHSLCAFANDINNWDGGYIIVGVEEENGIAKLPPLGLNPEQMDSFQKKLIELTYKISPSYVPVSQPYAINGKHILIIWAPAGDNRPYKAPVSLSDKKTEKAWYIKRGSMTIKVKESSDDERRLLELTARIPFDDRINQHSTLNDLSLHLIQEHLKEIMSSLYDESTKISFADLCKQMKIAKGTDENLRPTNAGLLMFNENPDKFFAGAKIEIVVHKGKVGKDYSEKIFTGSIVKQLRDALSFIKSNIIQEYVSKAPNQAEAVRYFDYPYQAIEEALVNAAYHKSYERENPVEIQVHPDKIEILSFPGPMPPIDKKMLKMERVVAREYRNRKLGSFLKELKLTEGRGTGLPIIYRSLEENGSPPPVFETDDNLLYFLSIIKIHPLTQKGSTEEMDIETTDNVLQFNSLKDAIFYLRSSDIQITTKDNVQIINMLRNIARHLRSVNDLRLAQEEKQYRNKGDLVVVKTLMYCNTPKTREEIFKHIEIYNNSRNFSEYIKPVIELHWLQYTIPDKPTSKNQKYITAPYVIKWIEEENVNIKRTPVASSNIASVGYDAEKQILEIEMQHGAIYQYLDVPKEVYNGLLNAGSIGSYFMNEIKTKFEYHTK
ncbi:MAG: KTSC domain-containing protein [Prolixibacteraceae bacterium]|nr:KTSC domain-containing protein [Prolixibacteraceae bacterium]